jgi:hypothetical protein
MPADVDHPEVTMEARNGHTHTNGQPPAPPPADGGRGGDHDANGRFARGNRSGVNSRFSKANQAHRGPGCPFLRHMARVRSALFRALTDERVEEIVAALVALVVRDGNLAAAEFLIRHCVGPELRFNIDPDAVGVLELERLRAQGQADSLGNARLTPDAALALEKAYQAAASAGTVGEALADPAADLGPALLAELRRAGLDELARAAQAYRDQRTDGGRHER